MRKASLLRSGAFRFAILIAAIFAIGTGVLLAQVERSVNRYATEVASDSVAADDQDRSVIQAHPHGHQRDRRAVTFAAMVNRGQDQIVASHTRCGSGNAAREAMGLAIDQQIAELMFAHRLLAQRYGSDQL